MMNKGITAAQNDFRKLVESVDSACVSAFLKWARNETEVLLGEVNRCNEDIILDEIREDLRQSLPLNAIDESETIIFPEVGENSDCDPASTVHVDAFLYEEEQIDELCDDGKLSRNFCSKCGSKDVKPCTFLSHSISCSQLKYMFRFLLPDLRNKNVLDVGSRLGAVLYGAYLYSGASHIAGVEINERLCKIQQAAIDKYKMTDRIQISCSDICTRADLLQCADVVVLHNVFEFFMPVETQKSIWQMLYSSIRKPGCFLVVAPSIESSLESLQLSLDLPNWIEPVDITDQRKMAELSLFGSSDPDNSESDLDSIHLYKVKS